VGGEFAGEGVDGCEGAVEGGREGEGLKKEGG
jgi:hypothetical protein